MFNKVIRFNIFSHLLVSPSGLDNSKYIDILKKFGDAKFIPLIFIAVLFTDLNNIHMQMLLLKNNPINLNKKIQSFIIPKKDILKRLGLN